MRNRYDWRLRVMDEIAEPIPSGTRLTISRRKSIRIPVLWGTMIAAVGVACGMAAGGLWLQAVIPMLYPLFILSMNLIGEVRWWIRHGRT